MPAAPGSGRDVLDLGPTRSAGAGHVDRLHAGVDQPPGQVARDAPAHLLGDYWHRQGAGHRLDARQQACPARVALGLEGFLQWVQVEDQGVGVDHFDGATTCIHAETVIELHRSQVGVQRNVRRQVPDAE